MHEAGGLLYYDGANSNAVLGRSRPGDMGFDIVHLNTHKTFSTPHGGGGPGAGPLVVRDILEPYLPAPVLRKDGEHRYALDYDRPKSIGKVRSFYGNFGVLVRAYAYISALGAEGLREVSEAAVLTRPTSWPASATSSRCPTSGRCMHEFVGLGRAAHAARRAGARRGQAAARLRRAPADDLLSADRQRGAHGRADRDRVQGRPRRLRGGAARRRRRGAHRPRAAAARRRTPCRWGGSTKSRPRATRCSGSGSPTTEPAAAAAVTGDAARDRRAPPARRRCAPTPAGRRSSSCRCCGRRRRADGPATSGCCDEAGELDARRRYLWSAAGGLARQVPGALADARQRLRGGRPRRGAPAERRPAGAARRGLRVVVRRGRAGRHAAVRHARAPYEVVRDAMAAALSDARRGARRDPRRALHALAPVLLPAPCVTTCSWPAPRRSPWPRCRRDGRALVHGSVLERRPPAARWPPSRRRPASPGAATGWPRAVVAPDGETPVARRSLAAARRQTGDGRVRGRGPCGVRRSETTKRGAARR